MTNKSHNYKKSEHDSNEKSEHEIAGYDVVDLAKAPVTPPSPNSAKSEKPEALIREVKQEKTAPPGKTNKSFIIVGVVLLFLAAFLTIPFELATVALVALIGVLAIVAGAFFKV